MTGDPHFIRVLAAVLEEDPQAHVSAADVAAGLGWDGATTEQVRARLARHELIEVRPGPSKAGLIPERLPLALTPAGWAAAAEIGKG